MLSPPKDPPLARVPLRGLIARHGDGIGRPQLVQPTGKHSDASHAIGRRRGAPRGPPPRVPAAGMCKMGSTCGRFVESDARRARLRRADAAPAVAEARAAAGGSCGSGGGGAGGLRRRRLGDPPAPGGRRPAANGSSRRTADTSSGMEAVGKRGRADARPSRVRPGRLCWPRPARRRRGPSLGRKERRWWAHPAGLGVLAIGGAHALRQVVRGRSVPTTRTPLVEEAAVGLALFVVHHGSCCGREAAPRDDPRTRPLETPTTVGSPTRASSHSHRTRAWSERVHVPLRRDQGVL